MTLSEAIDTLPDALRLWVLWLTVAMVATPAVLLVWRATRRDGAIVAASSVAVIALMHWLHAEVGFVRLLGLPHVLVWTPLAVFLAWRLRHGDLPRAPRAAMAAFLASILVSLAFDYVDVARYLLGDRAPLTEAAA